MGRGHLAEVNPVGAGMGFRRLIYKGGGGMGAEGGGEFDREVVGVAAALADPIPDPNPVGQLNTAVQRARTLVGDGGGGGWWR